MATVLTPYSAKAERISRQLAILTGTIVIDATTDANGKLSPLTAAVGSIPAGRTLSQFFGVLHTVNIQVEPAVGFATVKYLFSYDMDNDAIVVYAETAETVGDDTSGVMLPLVSTAVAVTVSFVAFGTNRTGH